MTPNLRLTPPLPHGIRRPDAYGDGSYGASRDGGARQHHGLDFTGTLGEPVVCPLRSSVLWIGYAYPNDLRYRSLHLRSLDEPQFVVTMFYVEPKDDKSGEEYMPGDALGVLQDLRERYPADDEHSTAITPHCHVQCTWKGEIVDPTGYFGLTVAHGLESA